jgi:hypothetical protein
MVLLVSGMFANPWKRYRLRRGYIRHIEELYVTDNNDDDSKTLLRHHQNSPGHKYWSKRRGISKTDTHEGSSNEEDAPGVSRKHGALDLILCRNGKKELNRSSLFYVIYNSLQYYLETGAVFTFSFEPSKAFGKSKD